MEKHFSLGAAWAQLGDLIAMTIALFGAPASIAARLILTRKTRQDVLAWLAPLEALARRLLAIEAAQLPMRNDPPRFHAQGRIVSALRDAPRTELAEHSAQWRVRFVVWTGTGKRAASEPSGVKSRGINLNATALARRLEALRRLIENRDDAVKRLARVIAAHRPEIARRLAPFGHPGPVAELLSETQTALDAAFAANTS